MTANRALYERLGMERFESEAPLGDWAVYYRKPVEDQRLDVGDE